MRKNAFIAIVTFLMITISAMAQSNSYNMVIEMANGTKINIGPNDVKNIYFNDGQLVISGETIEQIAQANSNKMKWVEEYLESLKVYYNKVSNDLVSIQNLFGGELAQMNENIKQIQSNNYQVQIDNLHKDIDYFRYEIQALKTAIDQIKIPSFDGYLKSADLPDVVRDLLKDYYNRSEVDNLIKSTSSYFLTEYEAKYLIEEALKGYAKIGNVGLRENQVIQLIEEAFKNYTPESLTKEEVIEIIKETVEGMTSSGLTKEDVQKLIDDALSRFNNNLYTKDETEALLKRIIVDAYDAVRDRYYTKEQIDALLKELQSH